MCEQNHRPWGGSTGAECIGEGPGHAVVFVASSQPDDGHDNKDSLARNESER